MMHARVTFMAILVVCSAPALRAQTTETPAATHLSGDANGDGRVDISDAIYIMNWQFSGGPTPADLAPPAISSSSPVFEFEEFSEVGTSELIRTPGGVAWTLETTDVPAGHAVTIWVTIFNDPEQCRECSGGMPCGFDPCSFDQVDQYWGDGVISDEDGARLSGFFPVGVTEGSLGAQFGFDPVALEDPYQAEIHLLVRDHGPVDCDRIDEQIGAFEAECEACADVQVAIHEP